MIAISPELSNVIGTEFNSKDKSIANVLASVVSIIFKDTIPANDIGRGLYIDMYNYFINMIQ